MALAYKTPSRDSSPFSSPPTHNVSTPLPFPRRSRLQGIGMAVAAGVCTPKAGQRRKSASGVGSGGASPRTPTSRGAAKDPRTPARGGSASPRTPASGAAAPRRHSSTPKTKSVPILMIAKKCSSCPRGWAPVCVLRDGGKGSPLRRARTGSDTQPSPCQPKKFVKKLFQMTSYKSRTPPETKATPPQDPSKDAFCKQRTAHNRPWQEIGHVFH
ncbi:hypothetical protein BDA96_02G072800 [Sorghum bicolor]|uniref:Uncharacterized protein n=2 Tax=Sorghum bicolor TaxID=4558 RepID=A0A921RKG8_SORBI|nr:hypothetical protein BDA96_02G072800 [Sorghum bicolor]OQU88667.1 hypothetical protein SORBI_3002G071300 [Sorghum bicolor]